MNYRFSTNSPYIQAAMAQAVQALMNGGPLPPNCVVMAMPPYQQAHKMLPHGADAMMYPPQANYYGYPYANNPQSHYPSNYNYPIVSHKKNNNNKSKKNPRQQAAPHSNVYNSSSFDPYMRHLSWSRLFDHHPRKNSKQQNQEQNALHFDEKSNTSKQQRSDSSTSSSSTTSDETIRRVNVSHKQSSHSSTKQQTKGTLPFKYSSEFIPGMGKQQSQKVKPNDIFLVKKA
jgi:hypothetical protein